MNILIVEDIASSTFGGAERTLRSYCEFLSKNHRLHFVYDRTGNYVRDQGDIYGTMNQISLLPYGAQSAASWSRALFRLVRLCTQEKIDLVLTHVVHSVSMLRALRMLTRVRVAILFKWICSTERVGVQAEWGLRGLDCGVSVSNFVAEYWSRNGFPKHKMRVIPEGINTDLNGHSAGAIPARDPNAKLVVGFAGRIVPEKGLHVLLDAVGRYKQSGKKVRCLVAGTFDPHAGNPSSRYHEELRKQIDDLDLTSEVQFLGYVSPLDNWLRRLDLLVVPSLCQDAQPIVLLEAMVSKTPIVASRVGGIPEMMSGQFARWMFKPGDVRDLYAMLINFDELTRLQKAQLGTMYRQHAVMNYSIQNCHARLTEALI